MLLPLAFAAVAGWSRGTPSDDGKKGCNSHWRGRHRRLHGPLRRGSHREIAGGQSRHGRWRSATWPIPMAPSENFKCYDQTWGRVKSRTRPAVGNHEFHSKGASYYFEYFGAAAGDPKTGYYSYELGSWHVIVLNSECNEVGGCQSGSPEEKWLREDLAAHPVGCTLAYFHKPRFSSGLNHGDDLEVTPFLAGLVRLQRGTCPERSRPRLRDALHRRIPRAKPTRSAAFANSWLAPAARTIVNLA